MKKYLGGLLTAAAVFAVAPAAHATDFTPADPNFSVLYGNPHTGKTAVGATFFNYVDEANGATFSDTYTFEIGGKGVGSGSVTTSFSGEGNSVAFTDVLINGVSITDMKGGSLTSLSGNVSGFQIAANTPIHLTVEGTVTGSGVYSGTATFTPTAAVPELATWGMMILGFGVVGAAMRRQRSSAAGYRNGSTNVSFA